MPEDMAEDGENALISSKKKAWNEEEDRFVDPSMPIFHHGS